MIKSRKSTDRFKIGITVPLYNKADFILKTLECLESQVGVNLIVGVCDDASKDNSLDLVLNFAKNSKLDIRIFSNPYNLGPSETVKRCIELFLNEVTYIGFLSDDDMVDRNFFHTQLSNMKSNVALVSSGAVFIDSDGMRTGEYSNPVSFRFFRNLTPILMLRNNYVFGPGSLMKASDYSPSLLSPSGILLQDWRIWMKLSFKGKLVTQSKSKVYYRRHSNNLSGGKNVAELHLQVFSFQKEVISSEEFESYCANGSLFRRRLILALFIAGRFELGLCQHELEIITNISQKLKLKDLNFRNRPVTRCHSVRSLDDIDSGFVSTSAGSKLKTFLVKNFPILSLLKLFFASVAISIRCRF